MVVADDSHFFGSNRRVLDVERDRPLSRRHCCPPQDWARGGGHASEGNVIFLGRGCALPIFGGLILMSLRHRFAVLLSWWNWHTPQI